jgi:3-phenylpropionate/trans-cinnamate dioxygenase ferredoxin reductase component
MIEPDAPVVLVGAGQAGSQFAVSLREAGHGGPITVVGDETWLPYQRPPLSKAGDLAHLFEAHDVQLRSPSSYERAGVELRCGVAVVGIDRDRRRVALATGEDLGYAHLVLATGTRPRPLPVPGAGLRGVHFLRTLEDANRLRPLLAGSTNPLVIGGGLIGLEIAASAAAQGRSGTIVEMADRIMAPAVSPIVATHVEGVHDSRGTRLLRSSKVDSLVDDGAGGVGSVLLGDGRQLPADLVVVAIGVEPNTTVATQAGLQVDNGIAVDGHLRTGDDRISAIGDCASFPGPGGHRIRLESVQNAVDQARFLSANLTGAEGVYQAVPWFWSNQFDLKLQFVGLGRDSDRYVVTEGRRATPSRSSGSPATSWCEWSR